MSLVARSLIEVVDPNSVMLRGYATITGVPFKFLDRQLFRVRHVVFEPGAFAAWLAELAGSPLPIHWHHNVDGFQIAESTDIHEDARGLQFTGTPIATTEAIDALTVMAGRVHTGASLLVDIGDTQKSDDGIEHIVQVVTVHEMGPAPTGANPEAFAEIVERDAEQPPAPASLPTDINAAMAAEIHRARAQLRRL